MFKAIKWAFKLGQQTERHRIANILEQSRPPRHFGIYDKSDRSKGDPVADHVSQIVNDIIDRIAVPQNYEQTSYSLLFPKEDK